MVVTFCGHREILNAEKTQLKDLLYTEIDELIKKGAIYDRYV